MHRFDTARYAPVSSAFGSRRAVPFPLLIQRPGSTYVDARAQSAGLANNHWSPTHHIMRSRLGAKGNLEHDLRTTSNEGRVG
jgi:hypothetical protein